MPLKKCTTKDGKSGWKFGDSGHCYPGKDGKQKAIKQAASYLKPSELKKELSASQLKISEIQQLFKDNCVYCMKEKDIIERISEYVSKNNKSPENK